MAQTKDIRNVCLMSHGNAGKTSLVEAMLYNAKLIDRLGKIEDGNTVSDFDAEEIKRANEQNTEDQQQLTALGNNIHVDQSQNHIGDDS